MTRKCQRPGCKNCTTFTSKHGCACPQIYDDHVTVFESREEREAAGRPVDPKWMQEQNVRTTTFYVLCRWLPEWVGYLKGSQIWQMGKTELK